MLGADVTLTAVQSDLHHAVCTILGASKENYERIVFTRAGSKRGGALQDRHSKVPCCVLKHSNVLKDVTIDDRYTLIYLVVLKMTHQKHYFDVTHPVVQLSK